MARRSTKPERPAPATKDDPTVAEVRRIRARLLKQAGGSIEQLAKMVDQRQRGGSPGTRAAAKRPKRAA